MDRRLHTVTGILFFLKLPEPSQQASKNLFQGVLLQRTKPVERAHSRKRSDALNQKGTGLEKGDANGDLEWRATQAGGVRHNRDQRSLSEKATLTTTAGLVLPAIPKSMSQTSPRCGVAIFSVQRLKQGR